ncbi:MAG: PHP domain-containing protein [Proteobacteria bacterium]|nr:PHP domain-containing protein [Pseudomonadota bacterium]
MLAFSGLTAHAAAREPDSILTGTMTGADHETYREVPFEVPAGVERLTLEFEYTGRQEKSVIDIGVRDPQRFRGWSGGDKSRVVIEEADATPSYLPGPLPAGTWSLLLGVPNIRKTSKAHFTARIWFDRPGTPFPGFATQPTKAGPGWYRGDLHMHTGYSDGSCASHKGAEVPCPVFKTLETASARHLDFVAVSDHNGISQNHSLRELAAYFDDLLVMPAQEITTFQGHANVFGVTSFLDFQLGSPRLPTLSRLLDEVQAAHGLISINHPGVPSGEACMGCGWRADVDFSRINAIEIVNGGTLDDTGAPDGRFSSLPLWESKLDSGLRLTGIAGSDNHNGTQAGKGASTVGIPTTVVHATELSQAAILEAISQGHVFVDVWGSGTARLELEAENHGKHAQMGDVLQASRGDKIDFTVRVTGVPAGVTVSFAGNGTRLMPAAGQRVGTNARFSVTADGLAHWIRADVRGPQGKTLLIGNPIYLRPQ